MTKEEAIRYLESQKTMILATTTPEGKPHTTVLWFNMMDGNLYFSTAKDSKKARNIHTRNYVSIIVQSGGDEFSTIKGVTLEGSTQTVTDPTLLKKYSELSVSKYWGSPENPVLKKMQEVPMERITFKLIPDKIRSWDYSKMGGK